MLILHFDMLRHGGSVIPIDSQMKSATNSKGRVNVDNEGRALKRGTGNVAKVGGGAGLGAVIGGIAGGRKGALIGASADTVAGIALVSLAADAPNITVLPGSRIVLSARARDNQSLTSLPVNRAQAVQPAAVAPVAARPQLIASSELAPGTSSPQPPSPPAAPAEAPAASSAQPDLTAVKSEFVPVEKTILVDDFTDMAGDEPPPHWKLRGGTAELRKGGDIRQLTFTNRRTDITPNFAELPKNFTMEVDFKFAGHDDAMIWEFRKKTGGPAMVLRLASVYTKLSVHCATPTERIGDQMIPMDWTKPVKSALWLQNGRLRLYVNGERVFDVNQIQFPELVAPVGTLTVFSDPKVEKYIGILYARFAESTPDFSQVIASSGRYVSHGILFDTNSDRLKPESSSVIKMIARALETNPVFKLRIEGHTDSVGNAAHNMDLSQRRAEAVKAVLSEQFKVEPDRLSTAGLGATKPIDSNDTAQGRAQNRRVEFVRQ